MCVTIYKSLSFLSSTITDEVVAKLDGGIILTIRDLKTAAEYQIQHVAGINALSAIVTIQDYTRNKMF